MSIKQHHTVWDLIKVPLGASAVLALIAFGFAPDMIEDGVMMLGLDDLGLGDLLALGGVTALTLGVLAFLYGYVRHHGWYHIDDA